MNAPQQSALYASAHDARLTFSDLVNAGFTADHIYLVAHDTPGIHVDQLYRLAALGGGEGLPDRSDAGTFPISALYDSLIRIGVDRERAEHLSEGVRRGGAVLVVTADHDPGLLRRILDRRAVNLLASVEGWSERGWKGWNPDLEPLDRKAIDRQRDFLWLEKPGT
jgi:hypothetical protein